MYLTVWPWEHLAVGYLLYSAFVHLTDNRSPETAPALVLAFGTQFPDLIDKTLAWTLSVVASGVSVAHSVFTAVCLSASVVVLSQRLGHRRLGVAFAVGYLAHIPADMLYPVLLGGRLHLEAYLWPLVTVTAPARGGFFANFTYYAAQFITFLGTGRGAVFLILEVVLLGTAVVVWLLDGRPVLEILPGFNSEIT